MKTDLKKLDYFLCDTFMVYESFSYYWKTLHKRYPKIFPLEMPEGKWRAAFSQWLYCTRNKKKRTLKPE